MIEPTTLEYWHSMGRFGGLCVVLVLSGLPFMVGGVVHRIQDGSADLCWSPDFEWPVPCDDEE